jgi:hypothetical protein
MATARVMTFWKSAEKLLVPVNNEVVGVLINLNHETDLRMN